MPAREHPGEGRSGAGRRFRRTARGHAGLGPVDRARRAAAADPALPRQAVAGTVSA